MGEDDVFCLMITCRRVVRGLPTVLNRNLSDSSFMIPKFQRTNIT